MPSCITRVSQLKFFVNSHLFLLLNCAGGSDFVFPQSFCFWFAVSDVSEYCDAYSSEYYPHCLTDMKQMTKSRHPTILYFYFHNWINHHRKWGIFQNMLQHLRKRLDRCMYRENLEGGSRISFCALSISWKNCALLKIKKFSTTWNGMWLLKCSSGSCFYSDICFPKIFYEKLQYSINFQRTYCIHYNFM